MPRVLNGIDPRSEMTTIKVIQDGPLVIDGDVTLLDHDGTPYDTSGWRRLSLCRCGLSKKKPFCDGNHYQAGFSATERSIEPS
jgi:CDGSH iron-sulfur domain-containing protein 3